MAEKKINGTTYRVDRVLATDALRMKVRIGKLFGAGLEDMAMAVVGAVSGGDDVKAQANTAIMSVIGTAFERCDPDEVVGLAGDIVSKAELKAPSGDYHRVDMDQDMTDKPKDLYPLIGFVVQEALGAFFPAGAASRIASGAAAKH